MRHLDLQLPETHGISIDLHAVPRDKIEGDRILLGTADFDASSKLLALARDNAGKIIYGAVAIEGQLQQGITNYLFGIGYNCTPQRNFFVRNILESSHLEFSSKLSIYTKILEEIKDFHSNKDREEFEKIIRRIMLYRNAMAHGKLKTINGNVIIEYYRNEKVTKTIDEPYLAEIEGAFTQAFNTVKIKNEKINAVLQVGSELKGPGLQGGMRNP